MLMLSVFLGLVKGRLPSREKFHELWVSPASFRRRVNLCCLTACGVVRFLPFLFSKVKGVLPLWETGWILGYLRTA